MKTPLRLFPLFTVIAASLSGAADPAIEAVRHADDAWVSATIAGDRGQLGAILSDDLNFAHSGGAVNNKAAFIDSIASGRAKYLSISYESRDFKAVAAGIVLITGRGTFRSVYNGQPIETHVSFLSVWREEGGVWRFLAWQGGRLPEDKH